MPRRLVVAVLLAGWMGAPVRASQPAAAVDPVLVVLDAVERAVRQGTPDPLAAVLAPDVDRAALAQFDAQWIVAGTTEATVRERDRLEVRGGLRVAADGFVVRGASGRLTTWQFELVRGDDGALRIRHMQTLGVLDGLYRLSLDANRQYQATDFRIVAEDFTLSLPRGAVFLATVPAGPTALVLLGRGEMTFSPSPATERGQIRLLTGQETLRTRFDAAYVRLNPGEIGDHLAGPSLQPGPVDPDILKDADEVFRESMPRSFSVDLTDLARDVWSLVPPMGDFVAEVRTRRFGTLTYAHAVSEPEDISLFDREHRHNLSVYTSKARLESQGRFYSDDDRLPYEVAESTVDASFAPDRHWFDARAQLRLRVRAQALATFTLRLAAPLTVRSITNPIYGRLLFVRVRNQDSVVVNLPAAVPRGTDLELAISYAGRLEPQMLDREVLALPPQYVPSDEPPLLTRVDPSFLYSNRSYWYPQGPVTTYGTATVRMNLPRSYAAVCTGDPTPGSPVDTETSAGEPRSVYIFKAERPVRYLGCVIGHLVPGASRTGPIGTTAAPATSGGASDGPGANPAVLRLASRSTLRQHDRTRDTVARAADIASFYVGLLHDVPYPSFTVALVESHLPGGHSPAYFAALNSPLAGSPILWRNDPAAFDHYPEFFLAHELAHQWWGQAVGWNNYHEQWLSEGFAQYFAALYAEHARGQDVFDGIIRSMSRWAIDMSDQGPVYLGYRLGHLRNDSRVFRAVVYNKGAMVLHMLRRLVGDDAFFRGLARFYATYRFRKAGTDELRRAFEAEAGRPLARFFEEWVYGSELPTLRWTSRVEGKDGSSAVVVRFEQGPRVFEFPITVTLRLRDGTTQDVIVPIDARIVERRIPLTARLRGLEVNRDHAALVRNR